MDSRHSHGYPILVSHQSNKHIHQFGIELGSLAVDELLQGFFCGKLAAVGPRAGHRVKGVGYRKDPALERDLLPFSPRGYPRPSHHSWCLRMASAIGARSGAA